MTPQNSQPDDDNQRPATDLNSLNPVVRSIEKAVTELQTARTYIEENLKEGRNDMKNILQALARLETKVGDLPSKSWIGTAVAGGVAVASALVALVYKIATGH